MRTKIGILYDNISKNMGDTAIGMSLRMLMSRWGCNYDELIIGHFNPQCYSKIIVGGGHLIREWYDGIFKQFRVEGNHILNAMGIVGNPDDLWYLRYYDYVSVRSTGDKKKLDYLNIPVKVVPCTSLLITPKRVDVKIVKESIGVNIIRHCVNISNLARILNQLDYHVYLIPMTAYNRDYMDLVELSTHLKRFTLLPIMRPDEVMYVIGRLRLLIVHSLHGAMFAYKQNVPFMLYNGSSYDDKRLFYMKDRDLVEYLFDSEVEIEKMLGDILENGVNYNVEKENNMLEEHINRIRDLLPKNVYTIPGTDSYDKEDRAMYYKVIDDNKHLRKLVMEMNRWHRRYSIAKLILDYISSFIKRTKLYSFVCKIYM